MHLKVRTLFINTWPVLFLQLGSNFILCSTVRCSTYTPVHFWHHSYLSSATVQILQPGGFVKEGLIVCDAVSFEKLAAGSFRDYKFLLLDIRFGPTWLHPKCLCFRIKRTWYLRSNSEEKSQTFCGRQWEYSGRCRANSEEQKRFPVIAIKLQSFPTNVAAVFLRQPPIGCQISLSDWGWCISGEVLMLLALAKNSRARPPD